MASIVPDYEVNSIGGYNPDDSWSRDSTDGYVTGAHYSDLDDYNGTKVEGKGPWFAVVVGYQTGDTFGSDFAATVVDAFEDSEKAEVLAKAIDEKYGGSTLGRKSEYAFTVGGKEYYADWEGYFEHLRSVGVYQVSKRHFNRSY